MTINSPRNLLCCSSLCLLLLAGCGGSATEPQSDRFTHPFTWDEWVEREAGERNESSGPPFYGTGLPNMSNWRAQDFLPEDYLAESHEDVCTLPREERDRIYDMTRHLAGRPSPDNRLDYELGLARQGFMEAQARMGTYCAQVLVDAYLEPGELTTAEALDWTRRAAASGNPGAMYRLAECMMKISREQETFEEKTGKPLSAFWVDETFYWLQRAAFEYLEIFALQDLQSRVSWRMSSEDWNTDEGQIELYLFSRLIELNAIFHRKPQWLGWSYVNDMSRIESYREEMIKRNALAAGEAHVKEWLHANPGVWDRIYFHPIDLSQQSLCPGEQGYSARFDYDALNEQLAAFGLEVSPPTAPKNMGQDSVEAGN